MTMGKIFQITIDVEDVTGQDIEHLLDGDDGLWDAGGEIAGWHQGEDSKRNFIVKTNGRLYRFPKGYLFQGLMNHLFPAPEERADGEKT